MKLIERNYYLDKLIRVIDIPDIKAITGVRRCGKSKLLEALQNHITKNYDNVNVIHINYNLKKFDKIAIGDLLYDYVDKQFIDGKDNYILIDEIQKCEILRKLLTVFMLKKDLKFLLLDQMLSCLVVIWLHYLQVEHLKYLYFYFLLRNN